jgi:hypothetical protein
MQERMKLALVSLIVAAAATAPATGATKPLAVDDRVGTSANVEDRFVAAANRGDYAAVCHLYSPRYLKVSQQSCRSLYRWGASVYGRYDYRILHRRTLPSGRRHIDLTLWHHASFIEVAREPAGWRIVAGGW